MDNKPTTIIFPRIAAGAAVEVLRRVPGLDVFPGSAHAADLELHYAGHKALVSIAARSTVNTAVAHEIIAGGRAQEIPIIATGGTVTRDARQMLQEARVGCIDANGYVHIELPGLLVHIEDRKATKGVKKAPEDKPLLRGKAALVAQAILLHPDRPWHGSELAVAAGVSQPFAHHVLVRLQAANILRVEGAGPKRTRQLQAPDRLLDLWAEENRERVEQTRGYMLAQTPRDLARKLAERLSDAGVEYALTGAAAAAVVAPFATAIPTTEVWLAGDLDTASVVEAVNVDVVDSGANVVFLRARDGNPLYEKQQVDDLWLVNRFRLYVDLHKNPKRGREQAQNVREELIGF